MTSVYLRGLADELAHALREAHFNDCDMHDDCWYCAALTAYEDAFGAHVEQPAYEADPAGPGKGGHSER